METIKKTESFHNKILFQQYTQFVYTFTRVVSHQINRIIRESLKWVFLSRETLKEYKLEQTVEK